MGQDCSRVVLCGGISGAVALGFFKQTQLLILSDARYHGPQFGQQTSPFPDLGPGGGAQLLGSCLKLSRLDVLVFHK